MKKLTALLFACLLLAVSGCSSVNSTNLAKMLAALPEVNGADIRQSTTTPLYSHQESVSGIKTDPSGKVTITAASAAFTIPLWGVKWDMSFSSLEITAQQKQTLVTQLHKP